MCITDKDVLVQYDSITIVYVCMRMCVCMCMCMYVCVLGCYTPYLVNNVSHMILVLL